MKKEVAKLLRKAIDSLILSVEIFNRPSDAGRSTASLIFMDHSFEMLLKASIIHKGGDIREKDSPNTIGFDKCLRKAVSDANVKFLTEEQVLNLQSINGERDAAQHYILDISEQQLYFHMQTGFTLFSDILKNVFNQTLSKYLPARVLPIATMIPTDICTLFKYEVNEIKKMLAPHTRKRSEAIAKLRPLAIFNSAVLGEKNTQLSERDMVKLVSLIRAGQNWDEVFPGLAMIDIDRQGEGPKISLRISKKADVEVALVKESSSDTGVVAVKTVNALEYYNLGLYQMRDNLKKTFPWINQNNLQVIVKHLNIKDNIEYYKEFKIGAQTYKRYSKKALDYIFSQIPITDAEHHYLDW